MPNRPPANRLHPDAVLSPWTPDGADVRLGNAPPVHLTATERPVVELLDGTRDPTALIEAAGQLQPPHGPLEVLGLLGRLQGAGLLLSAEPGHEVALVATPTPAETRSLAGQLARLVVGLLGVLAIQATATSTPYDSVAHASPVDHLRDAVLIALGLLLGRLVVQAMVLAVQGIRPAPRWAWTPLPRLSLSRMPDLAPRQLEQLALAGQFALAAPVLLFAGLMSTGPGLWLPGLLVVGTLAPYLPTDGATLLALHTRIPELRRRSLAFLVRKALRNLLDGRPLSLLEKRYLLVASAWLGHGLVSLALLGLVLVPASLSFAAASVTRRLPVWQWVLGAVPAVLALGALLALLGGLGWVVAGFLRQATARRQGDRPQAAEDLQGTAAADFAQAAGAIPFLARLGDAALADLARQARRETYPAGATILRQGEPGDRFCFLASGQVRVLVEEESGLQHHAATLRPGDFFGETALLEPVPRTATVVAEGPVELHTLTRDRFLQAVQQAGEAGAAVRDQLRNATCLRGHPLFQGLHAPELRRLLAELHAEPMTAGQPILRQGEVGDDLFVVREGRVAVRRDDGDRCRILAHLGPGDWFGELVLLGAATRTASVVATHDGTVLRLSRRALDEVLLQDLSAATRLHEVAAERLATLRHTYGDAAWSADGVAAGQEAA